MTNRTIDIYANTRLQSAGISFPDGRSLGFGPDEYDQFGDLMRCLKPIEDVEQKSPTFTDDYALSWFAGMDPATIRVRVLETGKLRYTLDDYCYTGGNAKRFRELADSLLETYADRLRD